MRERGAMRNPQPSGSFSLLTIRQRFPGRSWTSGTVRWSAPPDVPLSQFPGRLGSYNSIFVDGFKLFPQMDVWSRSDVGRTFKESQSAVRQHRAAVLNSGVFGIILLLKV